MRRFWIFTILIATISGFVSYYSLHSQKTVVVDQPRVSVATVKVTYQNLPNFIELVGTISPNQSVAVKSRLDSQIMEIHFKDGQKVNKGQLLFTLDDRLLLAELDQLKATLERAKAELGRAERQWIRDEKLTGKGFSSQEKYDQSKSAYEFAKASLNETEAQISRIKTQLDYTVIKSPIDGIAGTILLTLGNTVKANDGNPLVQINQVDPIKVNIPIPQKHYSEILDKIKNQPLKVLIKKQDGSLITNGQLTYNNNSFDEQTRTLSFFAVIENKEEILWPGMFVDVDIDINNEKSELTLPLSAIKPGQGGYYVFKLEGDTVKKVDVQLIRSYQKFAVISANLQEGDEVVIEGQMRLKDGSLVSIRNATPSSEAKK